MAQTGPGAAHGPHRGRGARGPWPEDVDCSLLTRRSKRLYTKRSNENSKDETCNNVAFQSLLFLPGLSRSDSPAPRASDMEHAEPWEVQPPTGSAELRPSQPHKGWKHEQNRRQPRASARLPAPCLLGGSKSQDRQEKRRADAHRAAGPDPTQAPKSELAPPRSSAQRAHEAGSCRAPAGLVAGRGSGSPVSAFGSQATQSAQGHEAVASPVSSLACQPSLGQPHLEAQPDPGEDRGERRVGGRPLPPKGRLHAQSQAREAKHTEPAGGEGRGENGPSREESGAGPRGCVPPPPLPPRLGTECPPLQPPSECRSEVPRRPASTPRPHGVTLPGHPSVPGQRFASAQTSRATVARRTR